MESARLDFWPRLVGTLRDDGGGRVARVAARGIRGAARVRCWLFLVQLALNAAWTPLFFGLHRPDLAFVDIILLWLAITATIAAFRHAHHGAALLLVPYLGWVSFASALNFTLWRMNP